MESQVVSAILDGVPLPVVLIDRLEKISRANPAATRVFGANMVGRHYILTLRQPDLAEVITRALQQNASGQARYVIPGPNSETVFRATISPVADSTQRGAICVFEDITELEQVGQMRRDFVANVSHELRTPLTALLGFIETLRGAARDDAVARARFLGIMAREAERMNRLVRDLLSLSRVEAEERVRPKDRVDLRAIVTSVAATLRPLAAETGARIEITGDEGPFEAPADADQLTQVFGNLIENAIKYGAPGQVITLDLRRIEREPNLRGPALSIEVEDRGEGIDPVHIPRLTERFYRVDTHRSREKGGTGLGLAIVKHIISRHRGRLRIESELGRGSRFAVILPAV